MDVFKSFLIALGMYSALPIPNAAWEKKSMRYALAFFPVVGLLIGGGYWCWWKLCIHLHFNTVLFAAGLTLIPVFVTGGIHLDGFCDTVDALSSHAERQRKLEILKDSHTGAFAIVGLASYFLLFFGFASQLRMDGAVLSILTLGSVLSRSLSGFAIADFHCAKNSGLAYTFADAAAKKQVRAILGACVLLCLAGAFFISLPYGTAVFLACLLSFSYYRHMSCRQFGGITGDLAGFFLQICELGILVGVVVSQSL